MSQKNDVKNARIILDNFKKKGLNKEGKRLVLKNNTNWSDQKIETVLTRMEVEKD